MNAPDAAALRLCSIRRCFRWAPSQTAWKQLPIGGVRTATCDGQTVLRIAPDALSELAFQAFRDVSHLLRPGHLAQLRAILDDPEASGERPVRGAGSAEERQHRGRRRAADVPGHRHRDRVRQEGPARLGRRRRGGGAVLGRPSHLHRDQSALFADGAAVDVRGGEHRQQPAGAVRHHGGARRAPRRRVPSDVRRQGRRQREQVVPVPGDAGDPVAGAAAEVPRRQDAIARDVGVPAVSSGDRDRRHQRGDDAEDGEAGVDALAGHAADDRQQGGTRDPRSGDGTEGAGAVAHARHRRAVRRQVFLPRRAGDPPAAARRVAAGGHRRFMQRRSADPGEDHAGRRVPGAAGDRSGEVPAGDDRRTSRRRCGRGGPEPADGGDPRGSFRRIR